MFLKKYKIVLYTTFISLIFFSGCSSIDNTGANTVNEDNGFVSAEVIDDINTSTMLSVVKASIDPSSTNAFGYKAVKIVYKTQDISGNDINASGLLVIPTASEAYKQYLASLGKAFSISMICDNHGTIFTDAEAPSNVEVTNGLPDYAQAVLMSGYAGFASVLPDYVGYGSSNSSAHPYLIKEISAQNSLDMIKASIKYMEDNGVLLNYQLYVSGYSQGGHVAMSLAEKIEKNGFDMIDLKGVAPMAGPHDVEALANIELNASRTMLYPAFLGYLADSYSYTYDDLNINDMVNFPDANVYHSLFNGSYINVAIHVALGLADGVTDYGFGTHTANELFKDSFINDYQNNLNSAIRQRFIENKSYNNWTPNTKINLVHCLDDEIIPFSQSQNAFSALNATGADVTLSPIPTAILSQQVDASNPFVHANCALEAYGAALLWFDAIRQGQI